MDRAQFYRTFRINIVFCPAVSLFLIGSAICGAAPTMDSLITGRAICGLGGSRMSMGSLIILTIVTTPAERSHFMGLLGVAYAMGTILGPIIGGSFADSHESWRWAFYLCLLIVVPLAPVYILLLPSVDPGFSLSISTRVRRMDWTGFMLFAGCVTCFVLFLSMGGAVWAWHSGRIIALIVLLALCLTSFAVQQRLSIFTAPERHFFSFTGDEVLGDAHPFRLNRRSFRYHAHHYVHPPAVPSVRAQ
jgi:MFS family permease